MPLSTTLQTLLDDLEALPANQDFDLLVTTAGQALQSGKPLASVVTSLIQNQQVQEHLAMVIVAAAKSLLLAKS